MQSDHLIRSKLRLPFIRPGLVSRPRLQEQVRQGLRGPLTLITAPAGFGKTTLVVSSISGGGTRAAWLSLDRNDNQSGRFLTYLVAAMHAADPRLGTEAAQLLLGAQQAHPEAVLISLMNDLDAENSDIVLVLDDYQFINSQAVHDAVSFIFEHCPGALHLLIATRSDPPLPLARLRARGQLLELRAADLRFTPAEAGQFLTEVMGLHLDPDSVAALDERTEGWIAGLQLAALSMRDRTDISGFIKGFSGTNRYILDYLIEEVLAKHPADAQRFLLDTSILERMSAPLCDAVLAPGEEERGVYQEPHSARQLAYLQRENLFLVSLDEAGGWFRYHHLFADLLKARLQLAQPERIPLLHLRASAWFEQEGFIPEAILHLLAARAVDQAADLIERYGPARWADQDLSVMLMSETLPLEVLAGRPKIGIYRAWLLINQGLIDQAFPLLKAIAYQFDHANTDPTCRWILTITRLALAFLIPPAVPESVPLPDEQCLFEIPASEVILRDAAEILYAMTLLRRQELDRAAEFSARCFQRVKMAPYAEPAGGALAVPSIVPFLATVYWFQGRLHAAASLCRETMHLLKEKGIRVSTAGNLEIVLGEILYDWNMLDEAEIQVREALKVNEPWRNIMTDAFGLVTLTHILLAKGDFSGAAQIAEKFEQRLQAQTRPNEFNKDYRTLKVLVQLAGGDLKAASEWADRACLLDDYSRHPEYYLTTLARIRLAQGRYAEVEELLAVETDQHLAGNRVIRQIESDLLLAAALAARQRLADAMERIDTCLALAEPEGIISIFLSTGEPVRELLVAYVRSPAPGHLGFAQKVLAAFPQARSREPQVSPAGGMLEPLSAREEEVLQLMAQGKTNPEIARRLIIAPGTVKAHAASIYRKLDAANRTEAVARARKLGILT